jgi:hypothetical protein
VVGYVSAMVGSGARSLIWGISARKALWSLNSVGIAVVIVGGGCYASVGMRINQWSRFVLVGVYVGVRGSPNRLSCVSVMKSARGLCKDSCCGDGVACKSPPSRTGVCVCSVVRRVCSHCRVSWYVWASILVRCCGR